MTFGAASEIFRAHIANIWGPAPDDFMLNVIKAALYGDTPNPDQNATLPLTGYGAAGSQWLAANEKTSPPTAWPVGGQAISGKGINTATAAAVYLTAGNTESEPDATLSDVRGVLVYNDTSSGKSGICYNSFGGGGQSVTAGKFTVVWSASGIARITL